MKEMSVEQTETNGINEPAVYAPLGPGEREDEPSLAVEITGDIVRLTLLKDSAPTHMEGAYDSAIRFLFRARSMARAAMCFPGRMQAERLAQAASLRLSAFRVLLGGGE